MNKQKLYISTCIKLSKSAKPIMQNFPKPIIYILFYNNTHHHHFTSLLASSHIIYKLKISHCIKSLHLHGFLKSIWQLGFLYLLKPSQKLDPLTHLKNHRLLIRPYNKHIRSAERTHQRLRNSKDDIIISYHICIINLLSTSRFKTLINILITLGKGAPPLIVDLCA